METMIIAMIRFYMTNVTNENYDHPPLNQPLIAECGVNYHDMIEIFEKLERKYKIRFSKAFKNFFRRDYTLTDIINEVKKKTKTA